MLTKLPKEQILEAYNRAPKLIRATFNAPETYEIISTIQSTYKMHVDVAGILSNEIGYLLLGLVDPATFLIRLQEAGISTNISNSIAQDVNTQIFVPLQKKMREAPTNDSDNEDEDDEALAEPVNSVFPPESFPVNRVPFVAQQAIVTSQFTPSAPTITAPEPLTHPQAQAVAAPALQIVTVPQPLMTHPRTMQQDMALMQQGNLHDAELGAPFVPVHSIVPVVFVSPTPPIAPSPTFAARPQTITSTPYVPPVPPPAWHSSPAASFQTASIPNTGQHAVDRGVHVSPPPLPNYFQPQMESHIPLQPYVPASAPVATPAQQPLARAYERPQPTPLTKEYGSDPYRELPQ